MMGGAPQNGSLLSKALCVGRCNLMPYLPRFSHHQWGSLCLLAFDKSTKHFNNAFDIGKVNPHMQKVWHMTYCGCPS
jgi:hypothetical protein